MGVTTEGGASTLGLTCCPIALNCSGLVNMTEQPLTPILDTVEIKTPPPKARAAQEIRFAVSACLDGLFPVRYGRMNPWRPEVSQGVVAVGRLIW
jgi:hypothetical protein